MRALWTDRPNCSQNMSQRVKRIRHLSTLELSDPTEIPPLSRDTCSNTPVALCFLWYRRLSLLHDQFFPYTSGLSQSKDSLGGGASQKKLASEAYRAIGGVARNSIANRALVGN